MTDAAITDAATTGTAATGTATTEGGTGLSEIDTSVHLAAGPRLVGDVTSFPSHAELARTLVEPGGVATLATLTPTGHPYTSVTPVSTVVGGSPMLCVSALAEHTQNLRRDRRASLLVRGRVPAGRDPLACPRVTLVGVAQPHEPTDDEVEHHLAVHPHAADYVGMPDFSWWHLIVRDVRYVGGFGVMGWAGPAEFAAAPPDPIIPAATAMIDHLNDDHADACVDIVRSLAGIDRAVSATVTGLDRYGITFDVVEAAGTEQPAGAVEPPAPNDAVATVVARVAFTEPLHAPSDVRGATVALVGRARAGEPR